MKYYILVISFALIHFISFGQSVIDRIPINIIDNFIFIELKINNSPDKLSFLFDTGAGVTVVDEKLLNKLGLVIHEETQIGTAGKTLKTNAANFNKILLGEKITLDSISLYLMDLTHLEKFLKTKVDGIIGFDLLENIIIETNIDASEMRFLSDSSFQYSSKAELLKLVNLESNHFGIPIEILPEKNQKSLFLILKVDTGADNYLTFHNNSVRKYQLINPNKHYKKRIGFSVDATKTTNLKGRVYSAIIGEKEWKNTPAIFEVDPVNDSSKRKADGLIGQKMLLDFNICYNLKNNSIYLEERK